MRVQITGSAGAIGSTLVEGLKERHQVRGYDREPTPGSRTFVVGDIVDEEKVRDAAAGMERSSTWSTCRGQWSTPCRT